MHRLVNLMAQSTCILKDILARGIEKDSIKGPHFCELDGIGADDFFTQQACLGSRELWVVA